MEKLDNVRKVGRDQTHAQLGLGMMSMLCETAWKQGTDLYGVLDNRFAERL